MRLPVVLPTVCLSWARSCWSEVGILEIWSVGWRLVGCGGKGGGDRMEWIGLGWDGRGGKGVPLAT